MNILVLMFCCILSRDILKLNAFIIWLLITKALQPIENFTRNFESRQSIIVSPNYRGDVTCDCSFLVFFFFCQK